MEFLSIDPFDVTRIEKAVETGSSAINNLEKWLEKRPSSVAWENPLPAIRDNFSDAVISLKNLVNVHSRAVESVNSLKDSLKEREESIERRLRDVEKYEEEKKQLEREKQELNEKRKELKEKEDEQTRTDAKQDLERELLKQSRKDLKADRRTLNQDIRDHGIEVGKFQSAKDNFASEEAQLGTDRSKFEKERATWDRKFRAMAGHLSELHLDVQTEVGGKGLGGTLENERPVPRRQLSAWLQTPVPVQGGNAVSPTESGGSPGEKRARSRQQRSSRKRVESRKGESAERHESDEESSGRSTPRPLKPSKPPMVPAKPARFRPGPPLGAQQPAHPSRSQTMPQSQAQIPVWLSDPVDPEIQGIWDRLVFSNPADWSEEQASLFKEQLLKYQKADVKTADRFRPLRVLESCADEQSKNPPSEMCFLQRSQKAGSQFVDHGQECSGCHTAKKKRPCLRITDRPDGKWLVMLRSPRPQESGGGA